MIWPSTLPQKFFQLSFKERFVSGVVKTGTDMGPGKRRRRFTAVPRFLSGNMVMSLTQYQTFESFYYNATMAGAEEFEWIHPLTDATIFCVFDGEVSAADQETGDVSVTFTVKVLP